MLNEEKVILMTKMASYEENEGKMNMRIGSFFRGDYVAIQIMKTIICATIAFAVGFALFIFYDFENFMQDIYKIDLLAYAKNILIYYVITVIVYVVITYIISTWRYLKARKSLGLFYQNLRKLNKMYKEH